jgi:uncharacterized protein YbcI
MSSIETIKPSDYRTITTEINKPLTSDIKKTRSTTSKKEIINPEKIRSDITEKSIIKPLYDILPTTEFIRNSGEEILSSSRRYRKKTMKSKKQKTQKRRHRK